MKYVWLAILFLELALLPVPTAPPMPEPSMRITIGSSPLQAWALFYREFKSEFMTCLYGAQVGDSVDVRWAVLASTKPSQVSDSGVTRPIYCPRLGGENHLVGIAHSHPSGQCGQSGADLRTFLGSGLAVSIIICSPHDLAVYTRPRLAGVRCTFDAEADLVPLSCASPDDVGAAAGPTGTSGPPSSQP